MTERGFEKNFRSPPVVTRGKKMKKIFQIAKITIIRYTTEGIIATSGYAANGVYGSGGWTDFSSGE